MRSPLRPFVPLTALAFVLTLSAACQREPAGPRHLVTADEVRALAGGADPVHDAGARALSAAFEDRLRLVGVKAPEAVKPGQLAEISLYFEVTKDIVTEPKVFVHGIAEGGEVNLVGADHPPVGGKHPPGEWSVGDVLEDTFTLRVPDPFPAERLIVMAGLYEGKDRWAVRRGKHDGDHRVEVARMTVAGGGAPLPTLEAHRRSAPIALDGALDEPDWQRAARAGPFVSWDGKRRLQRPTWVRVLWDDESLWVAFECDDADAHTPYDKRDDPLYESEAVEIFIDANGDKDVYVELQAAPNDVHFDAAFKGGRRKNFDTGYDVAFETKTKIRGTLNDPSDKDEGWVSEWRVPIAEIRGASAPAAGDSWQVNFFRLERIRRGDKVIRTEASAWSTPLSGDFHNLDRFGTLRFLE